MANVNVTLVESEDTVQTDEAGIYKLNTGYVGTGTLEFALENYETQTIPVDVQEGEPQTLDVKLKKM